jgi:N-formylglutamate amidohydrolase
MSDKGLTTGTSISPRFPAPFKVRQPNGTLSACIFTSPHSGANYPPDFVAVSRLDPVALRGSEDAFIDELFASAPDQGSPLLCAAYPRAFVDLNREAWELDPSMFDGELPHYINTSSQRVTGGLGTIARVVSNGSEIYAGKLAFAEAEQRIREIYMPYHDTLKNLIVATQQTQDCAIVVDCHSMPSIGGPMDKDRGRQRADIILGDRFGASCDALITDTAEQAFLDLGYTVARNLPYAGGFTTRNYGRPIGGIHTLQIEMNRALYMNEVDITRGVNFADVQSHMEVVISRLVNMKTDALGPKRH